MLHAAQQRLARCAACPLPDEWDLQPSIFLRAVLRLPTAHHVQRFLESLSASAQKTSVDCIFISSELSAAQRATRIRRFSKARENPTALELVRRRGLGSRGSLGGIVSCIGEGVLLESILSHLADQVLLVADSRCGDVGYNLQFATHILCPDLPRSVEEVRQLGGRAERLGSSAWAHQKSVQVICRPRPFTGELALLRHLQHGIQNLSSQGAARQDAG